MEKKSVREKVEDICGGRLPSLIELATQLGFKKDALECSQRSVCMRIGPAGGGEKILIYDNGRKYKNLRSGKSGDVVALSIEFMDRFCNRSYDWSAFYNEWERFYGVVKAMPTEQRDSMNNEAVQRVFVPFQPDRWEIKPFGPTSNVSLKSYMQYTRCIDHDTLAEMCGFFNTIKDTKYGTHNGKDIVNIGFPLYRLGEDTPCGFEIKNVSFKRTAPGSDVSNGMWSATRAELKDVKRILFFESAIDAISYVSVDRLRAKALGKERTVNLDTDMLVSCSGGPKIGQIVALKRACPNAQAVAAFDLDTAGHKHDIILNNIWTNQTIRTNKMNKREELLIPKDMVSTPEGEQRQKELRKEGWSRYDRIDGSVLMYKYTPACYEVKMDDKTAIIPADELTLPKLANSLKGYKIGIEREKPMRGEYFKVIEGNQVTVPIKDWNDRAVADKQERQAGLRKSVQKVGVFLQNQQAKEAEEQARRDAQIAKANERMQSRSKARQL